VDDIAAITSRIARNLARLRGARGFTFDRLAKKSGVSKGMLVQIEQGKTNPSIATLCRIANSLGITISRMVEDAQGPAARLVRAAEAIELWRGRKGGTGKLILGFDAPALTEIWDWDILPGESYDGPAHPAGTREVLYVREGELTLSAGGIQQKARASDTLTFQADHPHRYANESSTRLRFLMVVTEPSSVAGPKARRARGPKAA
jgi:transcriptional regulator with XRE-family HTH domain